MKVDKYMYAARDDAQVSVQTGNEGRRTRRDGLREDKGRSRSKNSIISADARTSLGFPSADNGALFEESFCARPRYPAAGALPFYLFLLRIHSFVSHTHLPLSFLPQFLIRFIE